MTEDKNFKKGKKRLLVLLLALLLIPSAGVITAAVVGYVPVQIVPLILVYHAFVVNVIASRENQFLQYRLKIFKMDNRGGVDFSKFMDMIIYLMMFPALINVISSFAGANLGNLQPVLDVFTNLLPIIVIFDTLGDIFKGLGGTAGSLFSKMFDIIILMIALPSLLSVFSNVTGTTTGFESITNVFMQILPIMLLFDLFSSIKR